MSAITKDEAGFDAWLASAKRKVLLPTGTWMEIVIPSARKLRIRGVFPRDLLPIVGKLENEGIQLSTLEDEELESFVRMMDYLVAEMIRSILIPDVKSTDEHPSGEWRPITVTGPDLSDAEIDEEDRSSLQAIALRKLTPNQVTIAARRDRALARVAEMTADEKRDLERRLRAEREIAEAADREIAAEDEGTVPGWQSFRGEPSGAGARQDGGEIRAAAERDARHPG